ncbi:hypothetical protein [Frankia sp. R82]|uniref:hypothetical protein n=1 Tax=Frankia sp. R82 TaxID=2950553 RepID=UPI00204307B5|nr:hypothetical protein [Frankia sp. R82]MCM3884818.1 hypothetical protein [Frankia sp. R82]
MRKSIVGSVMAVLATGSLAFYGPTAANASTFPGQLDPGDRLPSGRQIVSPNGVYVLQMQGDGNLVERAPGNIPINATSTDGHPGTIAVMQADGNFVLRAPGNIPIWSSRTDGHPGTVLQVQDDGAVDLYAPGHNILRVIFPPHEATVDNTSPIPR